MREKVNKVLEQAKILLKLQRYDDVHDFNHHKRVWNIAKKIVGRVDEPVNRDVLKIACMWHDVIIKNYAFKSKKHKLITTETANYLKNYMINLGFSLQEAQKAYFAVKHHEFSNKPLNIEGKILFDADKLDAFTPERSVWFAKSTQGKNALWSLKLFLLRIRLARFYVKRKFHFKYSRQLFEKSVRELNGNNEKHK